MAERQMIETKLSRFIIPTSSHIRLTHMRGGKKKGKKVWIDGWYDPLAGVSSMGHSLCLFDVRNEGSNDAVFGCHFNYKKSSVKGRNLIRLFRGTSCIQERVLQSPPIAVCCFYNSLKKPIVAVGTIDSVLMFENFRPYFRYVLPPIDVGSTENEIWTELKEGKMTVEIAYKEFTQMVESKLPLTNRSLEFLGIGRNKTVELQNFVKRRTEFSLVRSSTLTCMAVVHKTKEENNDVGQLIIGTENSKVIMLDPPGQKMEKEISLLGNVPMIFSVTGTISHGYRVLVGCRNGYVCVIRSGEVSGMSIQVPSAMVDVMWCGSDIAVGTMDRQIICYDRKGRKLYGIKLEATIQCMEVFDLTKYHGTKCVVVSLENKAIKIFNRKHLVSSIEARDVVIGMKFGTYGSEPSTLILNDINGGIDIKYVTRKADFSISGNTEPPKEQNQPLPLPKKSNLYLEQTEREKQFSREIHRQFQKDLCRMRLKTARSFVKLLTDGRGSYSEISGSEVSMSVELKGIGPIFYIKLNMKTTGSKILMDIPVVFKYDEKLYKLQKNMLVVSNLIPHLEYVFEVRVRALSDTLNDRIYCYVLHKNRIVPLITAVIQMPIPSV